MTAPSKSASRPASTACPTPPQPQTGATLSAERALPAPAHPSSGPWRVSPDGPGAPAAGWPLHDTQATRALEALVRPAENTLSLMQKAGWAVARLAVALAPLARRIVVLCGPGNNGGDGLEAAAHLHCLGLDVHVLACADPAGLPRDARAAWDRALAAGVRLEEVAAWPPAALHDMELGAQDLVVDALLGIGQSRPLEGHLQAAVRWARAARSQGAQLLAVDVPTGLDADTGCAFDTEDCIEADWTLSLLTLKPGLFTAQGRDTAGDVWWDDLGMMSVQNTDQIAVQNAAAGTVPPVARLGTRALALRLPGARRHAQHKGSFGDLWVLGGARSMAGALLLAARAAAAVGAGRVYACPLDPAAPLLDPLHPELMFRSAEQLRALGAEEIAQMWKNACLVAGCGGGETIRAWLPVLLERAPRLVLDADALNALSGDEHGLRRLSARRARGQPTVITPHPLEAARLLQPQAPDAAAVQRSRLHRAAELAVRCACTVVLKGSGTVIADPDHPPVINATGNASLATGGTGDVLAGMVGGWLAQGLGAREAAMRAVHEHGRLADDWAGRTHAPLLAPWLVDEPSRRARDGVGEPKRVPG